MVKKKKVKKVKKVKAPKLLLPSENIVITKNIDGIEVQDAMVK